jgi:hypothetical protein
MDITAKDRILYLRAQRRALAVTAGVVYGIICRYGIRLNLAVVRAYCVRFIFMDTYITKNGKQYTKYRFSQLDNVQRLFVSFAVVQCKKNGGVHIPTTLQDAENRRTIYARLDSLDILLPVVWNDCT